MKKLKKIKLAALSNVELQKAEMHKLLGGENCCGCTCRSWDQGGSSTIDNGGANYNDNWEGSGGYGTGQLA